MTPEERLVESARLITRLATEPGVSCVTCTHLSLSWASRGCTNPARYDLAPSAHALIHDVRAVCAGHEFGMGQSDHIFANMHREAFLKERGRLLEMVAHPDVSEGRRTELLCWLARPTEAQ